MHLRRSLVTGTFVLASLFRVALARADEPPAERSARLLLGYTFGEAPTAGFAVSLELFQHVAGDGRPLFYDLGAVLALRGDQVHLGASARHTMWVVGDPRCEQIVAVGPGIGLGAPSGSSVVAWVAGSFGYQRRWPTAAGPSAQASAGLHAAWLVQTGLARLRPTSSFGAAFSAGAADVSAPPR